MRDFSKRRGSGKDVSRFLITAAGVVVLFLIALGAVRASWGMYGKFSEAAQSDQESQANLATLKSQEARVISSVDALQSQRGVEAHIRQEYGVGKPGEGEIQIVRSASASSTITEQNGNVLGKIWQALFGWI